MNDPNFDAGRISRNGYEHYEEMRYYMMSDDMLQHLARNFRSARNAWLVRQRRKINAELGRLYSNRVDHGHTMAGQCDRLARISALEMESTLVSKQIDREAKENKSE